MNNSNNPSSVLVAGATGYLGSEICRQLIVKIRTSKVWYVQWDNKRY